MNPLSKLREAIHNRVMLMLHAILQWANRPHRNIITNKIAATTSQVIGGIIGLVLASYIAAYTVPSGISALANQSNWADTPVVIQSLGGIVLPIIVIVALILMFLKSADVV